MGKKMDALLTWTNFTISQGQEIFQTEFLSRQSTSVAGEKIKTRTARAIIRNRSSNRGWDSRSDMTPRKAAPHASIVVSYGCMRKDCLKPPK
jgi:hypothetical protein